MQAVGQVSIGHPVDDMGDEFLQEVDKGNVLNVTIQGPEIRANPSPHLEIRPVRSTSPDW